MNKLYVAVLVVVLSVGLVASASYAKSFMGEGGFMTFNSFDLLGVPVKNSQGGLLGLVNDVLLSSDGQAFAVVNHGDYDLGGEGGVNTPVPIAALQIAETKSGKEVVLNTDTEHMDFAPYLDWTKQNDRQYEANNDMYFGIQPSWGQEGAGIAPVKENWEKVRGVIENVNEAKKEIMVQNQKGEMAFSWSKQTKISEVTRKLSFSDLKKGIPVTIEYKREGNKLLAEWINVHMAKAGIKERENK